MQLTTHVRLMNPSLIDGKSATTLPKELSIELARQHSSGSFVPVLRTDAVGTQQPVWQLRSPLAQLVPAAGGWHGAKIGVVIFGSAGSG